MEPARLEKGETVTLGKHGRVVWTVDGVNVAGTVFLSNETATVRRIIYKYDISRKVRRTNGVPILEWWKQS
jgi:hypothetical protein